MRGFLLMLTFFTRIPLGKWVEYSDERYKNSLMTFPLVGILIGAFLTLPTWVPNIGSEIKSLSCLFIYIAITGGIHLDGVADSCDGLFSNRPKERVLEIMKDSHIGAFGVIALILYFMTFYVSVFSLDWKWLLLMPFVGKTFGCFSAGFSHYARRDSGMGFLFVNHFKPVQGFIYLSIMWGIASAALGQNGFIAVGVALGIMIWLLFKTKKVIGGHTGDTIGFAIELSQMTFIFVGAFLS